MKELPADALTLVEVPRWRSRRPTAAGAPRQDRPIWYLVPDGVVQYVTKRGLYDAQLDRDARSRTR